MRMQIELRINRSIKKQTSATGFSSPRDDVFFFQDESDLSLLLIFRRRLMEMLKFPRFERRSYRGIEIRPKRLIASSTRT